MQIIDQMEILKQIQPVRENKISKIEKIFIKGKGKQKAPLSIEYLDYLNIVVDYNILRSRRKYEKSKIVELEIPSLERIPSQVEYIDELLISGEEKPENEIQLIDQMEVPKSYEKEIPEEKPKVFLMKKQIDSIKLSSRSKIDEVPLVKEYIDELHIKGIELPVNEIQIIDQMQINKSHENEIPEVTIIKPKIPLQIAKTDLISFKEQPKKEQKPEPKMPNEIQNIDQMEIIPTPIKNLIIQNIDDLNIPRDYDRYQYIMKSSWEENQDVQASVRPIHAVGKETGLERQDIDNFEILGSIISQNLELEYINSIEIIERNNNNANIVMNNWDDLEIEFTEDLMITPDDNEIIAINNYRNNYNYRNNNQGGPGNNGNQGGHGNQDNQSNQDNQNNQGGHGYHGNQGGHGYHGNQGTHGYHDNQGNQGSHRYDGNQDNQDNYGNKGHRAGRINIGNISNYTGRRITEEENNIIDNNININSQSTHIRRNININYNNNNNNINNNNMENIDISGMGGMIIRTIEKQKIDQFEIIGKEAEIKKPKINLEIQKISDFTVIDNKIDTQIINENIDINMYKENRNNIIRNNIIDNIEINNNRQIISSTPIEIEKEKQRNYWNQVNSIQKTSKLYIPQKRSSHSFYQDSLNRSSWNENNRQQGIVNLSVIDDNKKVLENNDTNSKLNLTNEKNNIGINFNDKILQSSARPIRNNNNDYDTDGFDINSGMKKYEKKMENEKEKEKDFEEDEKEDKKRKDSKGSKNTGSINDKKKELTNKITSKGQQITYQYNTNQSIQSHHSSKQSSNKNINITNKQSPTDKLYEKDTSKEGKKVATVNINLEDSFKPISSKKTDVENSQNKKNLQININNKKLQVKPSGPGLTYEMSSKNYKKDDNMININLSKDKKLLYSNYPKTKTYERDSNPKLVPQSQNISITGKMKKKSKAKKFEYLREPNQSQNFQ